MVLAVKVMNRTTGKNEDLYRISKLDPGNQRWMSRAVREDMERKFRRADLVVYNIQEKSPKVVEERIQHDTDMVVRMIEAISDLNDPKGKLGSVTRLGKFIPGRARPIRIKFREQRDKIDLLSQTYKLAESRDEEVKKMKVSIDRTKQKMTTHKKLVD